MYEKNSQGFQIWKVFFFRWEDHGVLQERVGLEEMKQPGPSPKYSDANANALSPSQEFALDNSQKKESLFALD